MKATMSTCTTRTLRMKPIRSKTIHLTQVRGLVPIGGLSLRPIPRGSLRGFQHRRPGHACRVCCFLEVGVVDVIYERTSTLRAWTMGILCAVIFPGVNEFMSLRWPTVSISNVSAMHLPLAV